MSTILKNFLTGSATGDTGGTGGGTGGGTVVVEPLVPESATQNTSSTIPEGNNLVIVHNIGSADLVINGVTIAPGGYFTRETTEGNLPSYSITASDSYEVSVEHLDGQGGYSTTPAIA